MEEKIKVMIVDDNKEFLRLLTMFVDSQKDMEVVGTLNDGLNVVTKIKEFREKAGLTQADLAEKVGARRETIVHLENGKYNPSLKLAMDIARVFDVTVEELFTFTDGGK